MEPLLLDEFVRVKDHKDPDGMANLLIGWPNSRKAVEGFNFYCDTSKNRVGCEILQEEAEKRKRYDHEKYVN